MTDRTRPTVVVLGAGFGGLGAARKLAEAPVDVVLVDRHDYHTFQPLLYQVATDVLDVETVGHPVRELVHHQDNLRFLQCAVRAVDLDARRVELEDADPLDYDELVIALGAHVEFFGVPGAAEHAFPLYTLTDAVRIREHLLANFEAVERRPAAATDGHLDVVVVGGGATGVETAGAMAELYRSVLVEDYPDIDLRDASITLVERGDCLLGPFPPKLREYARHALEERGVVVRLGESVGSIDAAGVTLASGETLPAHTVVWGAGLAPSPLAASLGVPLEHGRVPVGADLTLPGRPEVSVVGDLAAVRDRGEGDVLPQLGSVALQAGEYVGRRLAEAHRHPDRDPGAHPPAPFHYRNKGTMATIGRGAAVVDLPGGHHLTGRLAFLAWSSVHLALLSGGDSRTSAFVNWGWNLFTHDRPARIILGEEPPEADR